MSTSCASRGKYHGQKLQKVSIKDTFKSIALFHHIRTRQHDNEAKEEATDETIGNDSAGVTTDQSPDGSCYRDNDVGPDSSLYLLQNSYQHFFKFRGKMKGLSQRILIAGYPGVGKTTLLKKLAYDWSLDEFTSDSGGIKLFIYLDLSNVDADAMIGDEIIKQCLPRNTCLDCSQIESCLSKYRDDVIVAFDAFDESIFASMSPDAKN